MRRVRTLDQLHVFDHPADGRTLGAVAEPVDGVHFRYGLERDLANRQVLAQLNQTIDIPGIESSLARPQVILLAHEASFTWAQP